MEDFVQQIPVQQSEEPDFEALELQTMEKTKLLFEYEMTSVLLNFRNEVKNLKGKDVSEYLDMEVPKASVDFTAPDIQLESVGFTQIPGRISFDTTASADIKASVNISELPEIHSVSVGMSCGDVSALPLKTIDGVNIPTVSVPDISGCAAAVTEKTVAAAVPEKMVFSPEIKSQQLIMPDITVPDTEIQFSGIKTADLSGNITKPSIHIDDAQGFKTPVLPEVRAVSIENGSAFENVSISAIEMKNDVQLAEISVPVQEVGVISLPEIQVKEISDVTPVIVDIPEKYSSVDIAAAPSVKKPDGIIIADISKGFCFPEIPPAETKTAEYPDIPEKPDFSAYYKDILDSLRAEN